VVWYQIPGYMHDTVMTLNVVLYVFSFDTAFWMEIEF